MFPAFSDCRECKLVKVGGASSSSSSSAFLQRRRRRNPRLSPQKLLDAHEEQDVDAFTDAVKDFDSITRLDQWQTSMLLRIKKTVRDEETDLR
ncbi:alpha-soluble NSF attachment protein-like [Denticeps clupeoides]|uniref:alpha-soluble NSF attachment protein-like n=1 Tax=Denticeps clupeoides TaxID=299321 RepID=UPI0010A366BE|nr:alpha-soluble NSF attachment protein-like [Denticeps clupeoides]